MTTLLPGSYAISHQDNIMFIDARGPFDEEFAKQYQKDIERVTKELSCKPWGSLVTFYGNGVFTPDAEAQLVETTKFRISKGLIANAAVFLESNHADLQQIQLRRVYQKYRIPFHVFSNVEHAKNWLEDFMKQEQLCS